jgi:hypothetical protein
MPAKVIMKKGDVYGRLTIVKEVNRDSAMRYFKCRCECGNFTVTSLGNLRSGTTKSCGCIMLDKPQTVTVNKGDRYNMWTVIREVEPTEYHNGKRRIVVRFALCKCDCGVKAEVSLKNLRSGQSKSCGCEQIRAAHENLVNAHKAVTKHGLSKHHLAGVYYGMLQRCYREESVEYHNYGGRGITVCDEWHDPVNGLPAFIAWEKTLPKSKRWRKGWEIDRRDNDGNYEPTNCHFVTPVDNQRNKRETLWVLVPKELTQAEVDSLRKYMRVNKKGKLEMPFIDLYELRGINGLHYCTAMSRLTKKDMLDWTPLEAVTTPPRKISPKGVSARRK